MLRQCLDGVNVLVTLWNRLLRTQRKRTRAAGGERGWAHRAGVRPGPGTDGPAHRVAAGWADMQVRGRAQGAAQGGSVSVWTVIPCFYLVKSQTDTLPTRGWSRPSARARTDRGVHRPLRDRIRGISSSSIGPRAGRGRRRSSDAQRPWVAGRSPCVGGDSVRVPPQPGGGRRIHLSGLRRQTDPERSTGLSAAHGGSNPRFAFLKGNAMCLPLRAGQSVDALVANPAA